jgi:hypothetical protein
MFFLFSSLCENADLSVATEHEGRYGCSAVDGQVHRLPFKPSEFRPTTVVPAKKVRSVDTFLECVSAMRDEHIVIVAHDPASYEYKVLLDCF